MAILRELVIYTGAYTANPWLYLLVCLLIPAVYTCLRKRKQTYTQAPITAITIHNELHQVRGHFRLEAEKMLAEGYFKVRYILTARSHTTHDSSSSKGSHFTFLPP